MINLYLNGASGRMGVAVKSIISETNDFNLLDKDLCEEHDCIIDFSRPDSCINLILESKNKKILTPLIIGTTGFNEQQLGVIEEAAKFSPILLSFNMSQGISNLKKGIKKIIEDLNSSTICTINDYHHVNKVDAPSGTAIELKNFIEEKDKNKSFREGDLFGIHEVDFKSNENQVTLKHKALSRLIFADGALHAAKKIINKNPGLYNLESI
jgi:4-hydroxy-tetrahydrodipicolinate reductase